MKTLFLSLMFVLISASYSFSNTAITYYTTTFKCQACLAIEGYITEVIQNSPYREQLQFHVVDIMQPENAFHIGRLGLVNKSVIIENSTTGQAYNLMDVWLYLNDKKAFMKYVHNAIDQFAKQGHL